MKNVWKVFFFLCLVCVCLLSSCATRTKYETVEVEVPVPVVVDIKDLVNPVLKQRPDNSQIEIHTGELLRLREQLENSAAYLCAWEKWQAYALALEDTLLLISDRLGTAPDSV